jgi:hypothetical protein
LATYKQASVYYQQERGFTEYLPWIVGGGIAVGVVGFIIYLALTPPPSASKKAYTVTVEVIDASTGNPVQGASVVLDSHSTSTDSTGIAVLSDVPAGSYLLTVNATGYQSYISSETIAQDTAIPVQLTSTSARSPPPPSSVTPVAKVIDPTTGAYLDSDTIQVGQEMRISTTVPSTTNPVSVQAVINGTPGAVHSWDISATGYNYIIDFGPAPNMPGNYTVYTKVTFSDGSVANSNTVQIQIVSSTAPPAPAPSLYTVTFVITDAASGAPISGALITMTSSTTGTTYKATTDSNGNATFSNIPGGTYAVSVSAANYQPDSFPLTVTQNVTFPLGLSTYPPVKGGPYPI